MIDENSNEVKEWDRKSREHIGSEPRRPRPEPARARGIERYNDALSFMIDNGNRSWALCADIPDRNLTNARGQGEDISTAQALKYRTSRVCKRPENPS